MPNPSLAAPPPLPPPTVVIKSHNPSKNYPFLAPGLTEHEYRNRFADFLQDLDLEGADKLSEGAFGIALRCTKRSTGKTYILKKVKLDGLASSKARREARDELKTECRLTVELSLQSPYVIQALGWIPQHGMLLEHATLGSIRSLMTYRQRPIPVPVVLHIVKTLILGLDSIHRSGYVHLDIKPANLFVHGDGRLVLGDLGLAAPVGSTRPGVAGSPRFMSRRQLMSDIKLTADLDWYAVAAVMVEFLDDGSTMFAGITKDDPVWSQGNVVNTVMSLHARNQYHCPKILMQMDGGLLLLEALRDGLMDPVRLVNCSPLTHASEIDFYNWATGRRTISSVPKRSSVASSLAMLPMPAMPAMPVVTRSSAAPIVRRVHAAKAASPYQRAPRTDRAAAAPNMAHQTLPWPSVAEFNDASRPPKMPFVKMSLPTPTEPDFSSLYDNQSEADKHFSAEPMPHSKIPVPTVPVSQPASMVADVPNISIAARSAPAPVSPNEPVPALAEVIFEADPFKTIVHPTTGKSMPPMPKIVDDVPAPSVVAVPETNAGVEAAVEVDVEITASKPQPRPPVRTGSEPLPRPQVALDEDEASQSDKTAISSGLFSDVDEAPASSNKEVDLCEEAPETQHLSVNASDAEEVSPAATPAKAHSPMAAPAELPAAPMHITVIEPRPAHVKVKVDTVSFHSAVSTLDDSLYSQDDYPYGPTSHLPHYKVMVPVASRRPSSIMGRLARAIRRLSGDKTPKLSTPHLVSVVPSNQSVKVHQPQPHCPAPSSPHHVAITIGTPRMPTVKVGDVTLKSHTTHKSKVGTMYSNKSMATASLGCQPPGMRRRINALVTRLSMSQSRS